MKRAIIFLTFGISVMLLGSSLMVAGLPDDALTPLGIALRDNTNWIWQ